MHTLHIPTRARMPLNSSSPCFLYTCGACMHSAQHAHITAAAAAHICKLQDARACCHKTWQNQALQLQARTVLPMPTLYMPTRARMPLNSSSPCSPYTSRPAGDASTSGAQCTHISTMCSRHAHSSASPAAYGPQTCQKSVSVSYTESRCKRKRHHQQHAASATNTAKAWCSVCAAGMPTPAHHLHNKPH
jgi:hypothetical protein